MGQFAIVISFNLLVLMYLCFCLQQLHVIDCSLYWHGCFSSLPVL